MKPNSSIYLYFNLMFLTFYIQSTCTCILILTNPSFRYILQNDKGVTVEILTLGGILHKLFVPDKDGNANDVITGYDNVEGM